MTDTILFDVADVKAKIDEIIAAHPDKVNPRDDYLGTCLYTSTTDPDDHCLVGQFAVAMGFPFADDEDEAADAVAEKNEWPITEAARNYLRYLQEQADRRTVEVPRPHPGTRWGDVNTHSPYQELNEL